MASPGVMDVIVDDLVLVLQKKNQGPLQKKNQVTLLSVPNVRHPTLGWAFIVASAFSKHFGWPPSIVSDRRPFVFVFALRTPRDHTRYSRQAQDWCKTYAPRSRTRS